MPLVIVYSFPPLGVGTTVAYRQTELLRLTLPSFHVLGRNRPKGDTGMPHSSSFGWYNHICKHTLARRKNAVRPVDVASSVRIVLVISLLHINSRLPENVAMTGIRDCKSPNRLWRTIPGVAGRSDG